MREQADNVIALLVIYVCLKKKQKNVKKTNMDGKMVMQKKTPFAYTFIKRYGY